MQVDIVGSGSFPQNSTTPTRAEAMAELASYVGGEGNAAALRRAGASYDSAVRMFNSVYWKFNRKVDSITLAAGSTASLSADFAAPIRAMVVDASGNDVYQLRWLEFGPFTEWTQPRVGSSSAPEVYSARNIHELGQILLWPTLGATLNYPTLNVYYFRRIVRAATDDTRLNVPEEVYQAIFQQALAIHIHKTEGKARETASEYALAAKMRQDVENQWRDWSDW